MNLGMSFFVMALLEAKLGLSLLCDRFSGIRKF